MNLPVRQALKQIIFVVAVIGALAMVIAISMPRAAAQTGTLTQTGSITSTKAITSTAATTNTNVVTSTSGVAVTSTNAITATGAATVTRALTSSVPTTNPNLPGNMLTGIPEDNPSDVVPAADSLTAGPGTPSAAPPPPNVSFNQDQAPLGSWPVTIALILIVLGVAWGAYQFLRKPATLPADGESDTLVKTIPPDEPKVVAPLTNEATTVVTDEARPEIAGTEVTTAPSEATVATDAATVAAATAAAAAPATTPPVATPLDLPDEMLPYLETLSRADEQLEYVLDRSYITVGRARTNDIVIDNSFVGWQTVSPYHAELRYQNGKFVVVDKQSDNGTFVNRVRTGSNVLDDGMSITFGKVEFIYRQPSK